MCIIYSKRSCIEKNEVNQSSSFCCIARTSLHFGQMDRQMMSNAIVANQLLGAKAANKTVNPTDWLGYGNLN